MRTDEEVIALSLERSLNLMVSSAFHGDAVHLDHGTVQTKHQHVDPMLCKIMKLKIIFRRLQRETRNSVDFGYAFYFSIV